MRTLKVFFLLSTILLSTNNARADILGDLAAPTATPTSTIVLATGAVLTLGIATIGKDWEHRLARDTAARKPLGNSLDKFGDHWGQVLPNIAYTGGMLIHYLITDNAISGERSMLMFKSTAYSAAVSTVLKFGVGEQRPNGSKYSFPSGHATTSFAFASVVGEEHPWYFGATAYAIGALVGVSRMDMNMHYLHDVVAGATIGTAYGLGLTARSHRNANGSAYNWQIMPSDDLHGIALYVDGSFLKLL